MASQGNFSQMYERRLKTQIQPTRSTVEHGDIIPPELLTATFLMTDTGSKVDNTRNHPVQQATAETQTDPIFGNGESCSPTSTIDRDVRVRDMPTLIVTTAANKTPMSQSVGVDKLPPLKKPVKTSTLGSGTPCNTVLKSDPEPEIEKQCDTSADVQALEIIETDRAPVSATLDEQNLTEIGEQALLHARLADGLEEQIFSRWESDSTANLGRSEVQDLLRR